VNDTDQSVTIWIEYNAEEYEPVGADSRLGAGERAKYSLAAPYSSVTEDGDFCMTGEVVARLDDGSEVRTPPPICLGDVVRVSG